MGAADARVFGHFTERQTRSKHDSILRFALQRAQFFQMSEADNELRRLLAALHVRVQIRSSGYVHPVRTGVRHHTDSFAHIFWLKVLKLWKSQHSQVLTFATVLSSIALPSPP